ncbi:MAG: hypothetical protein EHM55_06315 [Acidobacteria bacterium]|nr:MAG: hypothetical protein EHM55_06315 [Acidobacteriota bacterium]
MVHALPDARRPDLVVVLIALLSLPLFLYGLGNTYLWQDEAQTALLGRSVLRYGVPMVGQGTESLSAHMGADAGLHGIYFQISWLQAYVTAASFRLFGESSWSARVPFALAGWLCVPLIAWVVVRAGGNRAAARVAALLTATSIPFIVCSRQSRYYALTTAAVLLVAATYAIVVERAALRRPIGLASAAFAASATLLVLSFDVTAMGVLGVIAIHWALFSGQSRRATPFWVSWGVAVVVMLGWIGVSFSAPMRTDNAGLGAMPNRIWHGTFFYLGQIDSYVVPLPLAALAVLALRGRTRAPAILLGALAVGAVAGVLLSPYRFFRYIVPALPLIFGLTALGLVALAETGRIAKIAATAIVAVLATSTALQSLSHSVTGALAASTGIITVRNRSVPVRVPLADLLQELRDPPRGPIAAAIGHLKSHARPDDAIVTTYGELPLKFHTSLKVYGGETAQLPADGERVRWIWPRHLTTYTSVRGAVEWVEGELARGAYERIELDAIDRRWENREDPAEHVFTNPGPPGPPVVLYRASE